MLEPGIFSVEVREMEALAAGRIKHVTSTPYGAADGIRAQSCTAGGDSTVARGRQGSLSFAMVGGVVIFDPAKIRRQQDLPPVYIEGVGADGRSLAVTGAVDLPRGTRTLAIKYTAPSLNVPRRVRFKTRLEPLDRDWVDAGQMRSVHYDRLPGGRYRFRVIASNSDGVWNERGAALEVRVRRSFGAPLWWMLIGALLVGAVNLMFYLRAATTGRRRDETRALARATTDVGQQAGPRIGQGASG